MVQRSAVLPLSDLMATPAADRDRRAKAAPPSLMGVEAVPDEAVSQSPDLRGTIPDRSDLAVRKPKKRWPFQLVPVIALAICDRLT